LLLADVIEMMQKKNPQVFIFISIAILVVIDLIIKYWVSNHLAVGQLKAIWGENFYITRVDNLWMAWGINIPRSYFFEIFRFIPKILFAVVFIIILRRDTLMVFKIPAALVLFGWTGNLLDRLLFAAGKPAYLFMDYFYDNLFTGSVISISSTFANVGWILLPLFVILKFKSFKNIFQKSPAANS
jgi:signal peptidase II